MNWNRIVTGGLLAGLTMNVLELAFEPLMGAQMDVFFSRLGLAAPGEGAMVVVVLLTFVLGIMTVWLYAALEPRYGATKSTALLAGTVAWALSCLLPHAVLYVFGIFTAQFLWLATVFPLVESLLGTLAGAWVYRRGAARAHAFAAARP